MRRTPPLWRPTSCQGFTYNSELIELSGFEPDLVTNVSDRPTAGRAARYFAISGAPTVTNAYHQRVRLEPIHAVLLSLLDGTRERTQLAAELDRLIEPADGSTSGLEKLERLVEETLAFFAHSALLVE